MDGWVDGLKEGKKKRLMTIDEKGGCLDVRTDGWTHGWNVDKYSWNRSNVL